MIDAGRPGTSSIAQTREPQKPEKSREEIPHYAGHSLKTFRRTFRRPLDAGATPAREAANHATARSSRLKNKLHRGDVRLEEIVGIFGGGVAGDIPLTTQSLSGSAGSLSVVWPVWV